MRSRRLPPDWLPDPDVVANWLPPDAGTIAGFKLANIMSALVRAAAAEVPAISRIPEGPHFDYSLGPTLFSGRRGRGPLRIAWDTNLLIDYFDHGRALWEGDALPDLEREYGDELEGLQLIMTVWVMRDIRFYLPETILDDGGERLSAERWAARAAALAEFSRGLTLVEWDGDEREPAPLVLPQGELQRALRQVPEGADRELIAECLRERIHVFMTRDRGILDARRALSPFGLFLGSPLDVVEELASCGALHCLIDGRCAYWPVPDLQRVTHLLKALPDAVV